MTRPLYKELDTEKLKLRYGNAGLWYDKFCDLWCMNHEKPGLAKWTLESFTDKNKKTTNPKLDWINKITTGKIGDQDQLEEFSIRQRDLLEKHQGQPMFFETEGRFVTGLGRDHPVENGFAWHHTLGIPYLPGSSVKGLVRSWVDQWQPEDIANDAERIFGAKSQETPSIGTVIFLDALPVEHVYLEADIMTPHYAPYYQNGEPPADWHSPTPIPFLVVKGKQCFQFGVMPRKRDNDQHRKDCDKVKVWLTDALEWIGAGAKTAVGYGRLIECKYTLASLESKWVDGKVEKLTKQHKTDSDTVLRGKALANEWTKIEDSTLKQDVLNYIKSMWERFGWWEEPPGPAARYAKKIYNSG